MVKDFPAASQEGTREEVWGFFLNKALRDSLTVTLPIKVYQSSASLQLGLLGLFLNTTSLQQFKQFCPEYKHKYT